ncbi:MAG: hypothetical protein ABIP13_03295 [Tepidiformaceae bacterium]
MADATKSWALVVGIDRYNDDTVPPLDGAAADALAAVQWLRRLGVPDTQILLHTVASPTTAPAIAALGLPNGSTDASFDAIDASLVTLSESAGDRLYVFLAGHAVYEPSDGRLFLCQDFANRGALTTKTLGIDALARYLLSYPFPEQFLFMDGCQNFSYSAARRRKFRTALDGTTVTPDEANNGLLTVFGASMGELAQERNGRGAFFGTLLPALDPALLASLPPQQGLGRAITLDFQTGESLIDLEQLVGWAREAMQAAGVNQTPNCVKLGRAASGAMPLLRLSPAGLSEVTIELSPPGAAADVGEVTVTCDDIQARRRQPAIGATTVSFPDRFRIPLGIAATIVCRAKPGQKMVPAWERVDATSPQVTVRFEVEPAPAAMARAEPARLRVNLRQADGSPAYEMSGELYNGLQSEFGPAPGENVTLSHHETGPEFAVVGNGEADHQRVVEIAANWSARLNVEFAPRNISAATSGASGATTGVRLRFPDGVTAEQLAGPSAALSFVTIRPLGDSTQAEPPPQFSVAAVAGQEVRLPAGPVSVELDLPWGSWSHVVNIRPSGMTQVELPASVGSAPLRLALSGESKSGRRRIFGAGEWATGAPTGSTTDAGGTKRAELVAIASPGFAAWALAAPGNDTMVSLAAPVTLRFPLFGSRNFAVALNQGPPRVEPLSDIESPEWDLLVGAGRLDVLEPEQALRLVGDKWFDELLGLAGAYAIYAQLARDPARFGAFLATALVNLRERLNHQSPDLRLLELSLLRNDDQRDAELTVLARSGAVPLFRWGIPLALDLLSGSAAGSGTRRKWERLLTTYDEASSPASAWTVIVGDVAG